MVRADVDAAESGLDLCEAVDEKDDPEEDADHGHALCEEHCVNEPGGGLLPDRYGHVRSS